MRKAANSERGRRHPAPDTRGWNTTVVTACPACGKRCYETRASAKRAARQIGGRMRPCQCPAGVFWDLTSADAEETVRWREGGD